MKIFLYLDRGFDWWAKQIMKAASFLGINQKKTVRGYVVIAALVIPCYLLLSVPFHLDEVVSYLVSSIVLSIFHYFLFVRSYLREVERMIGDLERMGVDGAIPFRVEWGWGYQLSMVLSFQVACTVFFFFWPSIPHDPHSFRLLVWIAIPPGFHLYLMRHFDTTTKTTCKGLVRSGLKKLKDVFSPKPNPVPQPTS